MEEEEPGWSLAVPGGSAPEVRAGHVLVAAPHDLPAVVAVDELGRDAGAPGLVPDASAQAREDGFDRERGLFVRDDDRGGLLVDLDLAAQLARLLVAVARRLEKAAEQE